MSDMRERDERELAAAPESPESVEVDAGMKNEADINNRRNNDTKVGLTLRVVVAAYVLYLAYGLIQGFGETSGNDRILIGAAIVIFLAAGGAIMIISAKKLIRKEYRDADENTESTESEKTTEDEEKR